MIVKLQSSRRFVTSSNDERHLLPRHQHLRLLPQLVALVREVGEVPDHGVAAPHPQRVYPALVLHTGRVTTILMRLVL